MSYRIWDEEPTRRISALENPEEHEHSVLTRRGRPRNRGNPSHK